MIAPFFTTDSRFSIAAAFEVKIARHSFALAAEPKSNITKEAIAEGAIRVTVS